MRLYAALTDPLAHEDLWKNGTMLLPGFACYLKEFNGRWSMSRINSDCRLVAVFR